MVRQNAPERGDVYTTPLDPTAGKEQQGTRPVLVISTRAFNLTTGLAVVCPITSGGESARLAGFTVPITGHKTGGVVLCSQVRTVDLKVRKAMKTDRIDDTIVQEVLERVAAILA